MCLGGSISREWVVSFSVPPYEKIVLLPMTWYIAEAKGHSPELKEWKMGFQGFFNIRQGVSILPSFSIQEPIVHTQPYLPTIHLNHSNEKWGRSSSCSLV